MSFPKRICVLATAAFLFTGCLAAEQRDLVDESIPKAAGAELEGSLRSAASAQQQYRAQYGQYTTDLAALSEEGFNPTAEVVLSIPRADAESYCIQADARGLTMHLESGNPVPVPGPC